MSTPYDMFIVFEISISNEGLEDASSHVTLSFLSEATVQQVFMRSSRTYPYIETLCTIDSDSNYCHIKLQDIYQQNLRILGLLFLIQIPVDIHSQEELNSLNLSTKSIHFTLSYQAGFAEIAQSFSYNSSYLYSTLKTEKLYIENQYIKASTCMLLIFAGWLLLVILVIILQLQCNIFCVNKKREDEQITKEMQQEQEQKSFLKQSKQLLDKKVLTKKDMYLIKEEENSNTLFSPDQKRVSNLFSTEDKLKQYGEDRSSNVSLFDNTSGHKQKKSSFLTIETNNNEANSSIGTVRNH